MEQSVQPTTAGVTYGFSCVSCVRGKTRCVPSNRAAKCERCQRLNKDCQPSQTQRKKRVNKRTSTSINSVVEKTTALEGRIDGIYRMLQNSQTTPQQTVSPANTHDSYPPYEIPSNGRSASYASHNQTPSSGLDILANASLGSNGHFPESDGELRECLELYRTNMMGFFPIVVVHQNITVQDMQTQRPFLWLAIRVICGKNADRQTALSLELRKTLGEQIIVQGTRSLDLLLGLLVISGWGHQYFPKSQLYTVAVQLAVTLAADMGLSNPISQVSHGLMNYNEQGRPKPTETLYRTIEERRAIVGLFLVNSKAASYLQLTVSLNWTPYLDECLTILEEQKESPTDEHLVYLVKLQRIRNRIAEMISIGVVEKRHQMEAYIDLFGGQIEDFRRSVPSHLQDKVTLRLSILDTTISLHEHSLLPCHSEVTNDPSAQTKRLESLWACFNATKALMDIFGNTDIIPLSSYPQFPFTAMALSHSMIVLFRLSTFSSPTVPWDRQRIAREVNFADFVKDCLARWTKVPEAAGLQLSSDPLSEMDPWGCGTKGLLSILDFWETKIAPQLTPSTRGNLNLDTSMDNVASQEQDAVELMDYAPYNIDFIDDAWMKEMFGNGF